jgi:hypothetical protein
VQDGKRGKARFMPGKDKDHLVGLATSGGVSPPSWCRPSAAENHGKCTIATSTLPVMRSWIGLMESTQLPEATALLIGN